MGTMTALKASIVDYVERHALDGALHGAKAVAEFPSSERVYPLKKPVIAVGIESVALSGGALGGYYGSRPEGGADVYGRSALVTVYFDIHCPVFQGGEGCHAVYEALCDALLLGGCPFGFYRMWCGGVGYDGDTAANRLRVRAALRGAVTGEDTGIALRDFKLIRN